MEFHLFWQTNGQHGMFIISMQQQFPRQKANFILTQSLFQFSETSRIFSNNLSGPHNFFLARFWPAIKKI